MELTVAAAGGERRREGHTSDNVQRADEQA